MPASPHSLCCALALGIAACAAALPAHADQATAAACARTLPAEAQTIYQAAAPGVTPSTDLRSLLKTKVRAMVMDGQVQRATARKSAYAAFGCLKDLK